MNSLRAIKLKPKGATNMPTTYKSGKKKATAKKKPTKKPAKKGSKSGSKSGGGTGEAFGPQDPIIISGGGSVHVKINGKFKGNGPDKWRNADATLVSISIDGGTPTLLSPTSVITIRLA
jgi:hypothetical protein